MKLIVPNKVIIAILDIKKLKSHSEEKQLCLMVFLETTSVSKGILHLCYEIATNWPSLLL